MRSIVLVLTLALVGCASNDPVAEEIRKEPAKEYTLRGEVISVDTQISTAKIQHEAIGDWMGPMTMDFPVKNQAELAKLKPGEYVQAKLFVSGLDFWTEDFQPATAQPAAPAGPR